jgi:hypothetical protein
MVAKLWLHTSSKLCVYLYIYARKKENKKNNVDYHSHYFSCSKNVTRSKLITPKILSIEGLNNRRTGKVFIEDIMVVYITYLDKENKTRSIMCADMTDNEALMEVTLTIPTQLFQKHAEKVLPGNGIFITNFNILPKIVYDCGDFDHIISLNETSIVEKFPSIFLEYHFIPDTTIIQLAQSNDTYPFGTIGAFVTLARKLGSQHILHIKDGESDNDKAMVSFSISSFVLYFHMSMYLGYVTQLLHCSMLQLQLFHTYSNSFSSMEQQLHKGKFPLMLLKNITKKRDVKERIFRITQETFVT